MTEKEENQPKKSNLIPFDKMTKEEARIIQSKGGTTVSPQKKMAARLRELKKLGADNPSIKRIINIMEDPTCSALDIKLFLDSIKKKEYKKGEKVSVESLINLSNAYIKLHKAHHGDKKIIGGQGAGGFNVIINIIKPEDTAVKEIKVIKPIKEEKEDEENG